MNKAEFLVNLKCYRFAKQLYFVQCKNLHFVKNKPQVSLRREIKLSYLSCMVFYYLSSQLFNQYIVITTPTNKVDYWIFVRSFYFI